MNQAMTKDQALSILSEIEAICAKYGLWSAIELERKPELRMIRVKEISIKVDQEKTVPKG